MPFDARAIVPALMLGACLAGCSGDDEAKESPPGSGCTVPDGTFLGQLEVGLESDVAGADIHYTLDGTVPTPASEPFLGTPLTLTETTRVRVQGFQEGAPVGEGRSCLYVARQIEVSSDLPILVIDGFGRGKPEDKDVYFDAAVLVFEPVAGMTSLSSPATLSTVAGYHVRGQSSATYPKAPYRLEFWDETGEDRELPLLGMPDEADWALISPYVDRSLIRNAFVYSLGRDLGLAAPRFAFAEVYLNYDGGPLTSEHYQGVYLVSETIKNQKDRLNLKQLDETDVDPAVLSGGYIFKFDFAAAEEPIVPCTGSAPLSGGMFGGGTQGGTCWSDLEVVDPDPLTPVQAEWFRTHVQAFHDTLHTTPLGDWTSYADLASFVDNFILQELSRNMDAYVRSAYFHKDRDGKIKAGPLWDYDLTFDVGGSFGNRDSDGWQYQQRGGTNDWFHVLAEDPAFLEQVRTRYRALRQGPLSEAQLFARIDQLTAPLGNAAQRDFARWPSSEVRDSFFTFPEAETWEGQVQALRDWIPPRLSWLDGQL